MADRVEYIEIDVERCDLTYGVSPCSAEVGVTGSTKCYNSFHTCQDRAAYSPQSTDDTFRFKRPASYTDPTIEAIGNVIGIEYTPTTVSLQGDLGERASLKVRLKDHLHTDTGVEDPYLADRSYSQVESFNRGTYFGKFRARFWPLRGQVLRYYRGFSDQTLNEMEVRTFVIEEINGPLPDGTFTITAKDVLKQLDEDRALVPDLSSGFLTSDITDVATSASLSPSGIGNSEYPSSGLVAIGGKEIVSFTRSGDTLTITRAQEGTVASAHSANSRVQLVKKYDGEDPADILNDLLTTYAGVDSAYIPLTTWQAETDENLGQVYTRVLSEPQPVKRVVESLLKATATALWYDDLDAEIKLRVLRAVPAQTTVLNEDRFLADSIGIEEQYPLRRSEVWTYFAQSNPLDDDDDEDNYQSAVATVVPNSTTLFGGDPAITKIFAPWIPIGGRLVAQRLNDLVLSQFQEPPRKLTFRTFADKSLLVPKLGQVFDVQFRAFQDPTGALATPQFFITRVSARATHYDVEAQEFLYDAIDPLDLQDRQIVFDSDNQEVDLLTIHNQLYPSFDEDDTFSGTNAVTLTVIVESGVVIGSSNVNTPAMSIDGFPSGLDLTAIVRGRIQGAGGRGGDAAGAGSQDATDGGIALYTRVPINLILNQGNGEIWGGGGGGAGGTRKDSGKKPGSGGGGAGYDPGVAGVGASEANEGEDGTREAGGDGGTQTTSEASPGGDGGDPGQDGQDVGGGSFPFEPGGEAGDAINGSSYVTKTGTGDIRGDEVF